MTLPKMLLTLGIAGTVLLMAGCEQKQPAQGLLSDAEVTTLESLYGHEQDAVLKELGLSEKDVSEKEEASWCWVVNTPREMSGSAFEQTLLYDHDTNALYGESYDYLDPEGTRLSEMADLAFKLADEAREQYGEPLGIGTDHRLLPDGSLDALKNGEQTSGFDEWEIGENTRLTIGIRVVTDQAESGPWSQVLVEYRINTFDEDEWDAIVKEAAGE